MEEEEKQTWTMDQPTVCRQLVTDDVEHVVPHLSHVSLLINNK